MRTVNCAGMRLLVLAEHFADVIADVLATF
jgi:hypothetical protein